MTERRRREKTFRSVINTTKLLNGMTLMAGGGARKTKKWEKR